MSDCWSDAYLISTIISWAGSFGLNTKLRRFDVWYLSNTTLKELYLKSNRMTLVKRNALLLFPSSLEVLSATKNVLRYNSQWLLTKFEEGKDHWIEWLAWCGPRQANLVLIAYASSEGSGEPTHPRSLARTFVARSYKQWVKRNLQTESQIPGPSEWLGMRS